MLKRGWFVPSLVVPIVAIGAWIAWTSPTTGQDQTDERLIALETRVASQAAEIADLGARIGKIEAGGDMRGGDRLTQGEYDFITLGGTGISVTDTFNLTAGRYKVSGAVESSSELERFAVFIYPPEGMEDLLFDEIIEQSGVWTGSAVYEADVDGDYYAEIQNTSSPWTLLFERID